MFVRVNMEYPEIDAYRFRDKLVIQNELHSEYPRVILKCHTNSDPFHVAPMEPGSDLYNLLPLQVSDASDTWTYYFKMREHEVDGKVEPTFFIATILYFEDNDWGLILGEESFEMRFQVPQPLRRAWDRYRVKPSDVRNHVHVLRSVKDHH